MLNWYCLRPGSPPRFLKLRSSIGFITFVVVFSVFADAILYGIVVPVTPNALHERVGLSEDQEQKWSSNLLALYGASLLAVSPIAGYVADRLESRYWPFVVGLASLGIATALLCIGTSIALWVVGRLLQGASAAVVWTVGFALLADTVGNEGLGVAMGYVGMSMTLGLLCGPLLGGVLYGRSGYYGVFGLAFGLIGVDIILRVVMIERKHAAKWLQEQNHQPTLQDEKETKPHPECAETSPETPTSQQDCVHPVSSQDLHQGKKSNPFYAILASERMLAAIWACFMISVLLGSFDSVLPLFVKDTFGWGKTNQGLAFIPLAVPHILEPLVGQITDKFPRHRRYIAAGSLFAVVPPIVAMRLVTDNTISHKILLFAMLALVGTCIASLFPPIMVEASYVVQEKEASMPNVFGKRGGMAVSYAIINTAYAAGIIAGPFFAGYIRDSAGWKTMTWALALSAGVSGIPILLLLGGLWFKKR